MIVPKIFYVIAGETQYKKTDEKILRSFTELRKINYQNIGDYFDIKVILNIIWCDTIIMWFASRHSIPIILLNYFFQRRLIIIAGGFDVANLRKINYGGMQGGYRTNIGRWILNKADKIVAVSQSNKKEIIQNGRIHYSKVELIYNCIEPPIINKTNLKKKNQILTVGELNEETYLRKGIDRFIEIAKIFPEIKFYHIGKWTDNYGNLSKKKIEELISISPSNISYLGYVSRAILLEYYKVSKIYLQLSRHEAFGVSVAEAISYNCIPIVSNVYALPELIDEDGYIVDNINETVDKIEKTIKSKIDNRRTNRFLKKYSIESRSAGFKKILNRI